MFCLIFNMKKGRISSKRAQRVAQEFLSVLTNEGTVEGFMTSLSKKAEFYPEIREAFLKVALDYEKETVNEKIGNVRNILKGGLY